MKSDILGVLLAGAIGVTLITGCGAASSGTARSSISQQIQESAPEDGDADRSTADTLSLTGHTLMIYCGVGMTEPFQEITNNFKAATDYEMNVTYINAGQIRSQTTASEGGDIFIAGSAKELKPIESYVLKNKALIKRIFALAVQSGSSKSITSLVSLAEKSMSPTIGDMDSTLIGEITRKALTDAGILDKVQIETSIATIPQMATVAATREADATIIWKESCGTQGVEIVNNSDLEDYTKTIPATFLGYSVDHDAGQVFLDCLNSGDVQEIWLKYGYEIAE